MPSDNQSLEFPDLNPEPKKRVITEETRVETASEEAINSQLDSMTRRTTIEELARRGKTKNIKTLSERNLKQWIQEALRRVISQSTTIDEDEAERLLASTRSELGTIMAERQAEASNRAADAQKLDQMTAQVQSMGRQIAELEHQLNLSEAENYRLLEQVQDLDADLASKEYSSSNDAINALREELSVMKDKHAITQHEQTQLRKNLGRQLVASAEVVTALLAIDQRFYNGRHQPESNEQQGQEGGDVFFADQNAAAEVATQLRDDLGRIHSRLEDLVPAISQGDDGAIPADILRLDELMWVKEHEDTVEGLEQRLRESLAANTQGADATLQEEVDRLRAELDDAEITAEAYEARVAELNAQEADLAEELAGLKDRLKSQPVDSHALTEAQAKASGLREELDRLRREYDQGKKDNIILQGTLSSLRRQLQRAQEQLNARQAEPIAEFEAELKDLRDTIIAVREDRDRASEQALELGEQLLNAQQANAQLQQKLDELQSEQGQRYAEIDALREQLQQVSSNNAEETTAKALNEENLRAMREDRDQAKQHAQALEDQLRVAQQNSAQLLDQFNQLQSEQGRQLIEMEDLRQQLQANHETHEAQQAHANDLAALRQTLAEREAKLNTAEAMRQKLEHSLAEQAQELAAANTKATILKDQLDKQDDEIQSLKTKIAELGKEPPSTVLTESTPSEIPPQAEIAEALARARAVVTVADGAPFESMAGIISPRKPGMWFTAWRDPKGRLKIARTTGDRWVTAGRNKDLPAPENLFGEPSIIGNSEGGTAVYRDTDGKAQMVPFDKAGRICAAATTLGPALGIPGLSRVSGDAPTFIVRTDQAGHVHLHPGTGPSVNMHRLLDIPPAAGPACAWHWGLEGSRHISYRDIEGAIHELLELKGIWYHAPLSEQTGAPAASSDPLGYAPSDHEHVIYLGSDGHVHELCFDGRDWHHHDIHALTAGTPAAAAAPGGGYILGRHHIAFKGVDGHAHILRHNRDWRHHSLDELGTIDGHLHFSSCGDAGAIIYSTPNGERRCATITLDLNDITYKEMP
ncbi:MAG: hypothetical protein EA402_02045 [Planctomycetota bacterium]|nr:MAG: hypothetical protein EA402_02045 [Planctomycetota bacterium]